MNFDEVGFRVGCAKGQEILVPLDILEVRSYSTNFSITMESKVALTNLYLIFSSILSTLKTDGL